jgi:hypothetical protein
MLRRKHASDCALLGSKNGTAAMGVGAHHGRNNERLSNSLNRNLSHKTPLMTRLVPIWSDDRRCLQGWELA